MVRIRSIKGKILGNFGWTMSIDFGLTDWLHKTGNQTKWWPRNRSKFMFSVRFAR
jgi:hypothetical protein